MLFHGIIWCITFFLANGSLTGTLQKMYDGAMLSLQKFVGITTTKEPMLLGGYYNYDSYKNPEKNKKVLQEYKPGSLIRNPQVHDISGEGDGAMGCPPDPCYNPCVNPNPCCKQQCHTIKRPTVEVPWSHENKPQYPQHPPNRDAPCLAKMYCNGQWKHMKGTPGIGTCFSRRCDTKNLTACHMILAGEHQKVGCIGAGCTASCSGSDCTTDENSRGLRITRNGYALNRALLVRHQKRCGSSDEMARERKERQLVYFDMDFYNDDVVGSLLGR